MSETLEQRITRHEGLKLRPYPDSRGILTIGVGRNLQQVGISEEEAFYLLKNDIAHAREDLLEYFPWAAKLDTIRQEVLIEMIFQLGINGISAFKNTLAAIQNSDWEGAAEGMLSSMWHKQTPKRVEELAGLMRAGSA